MSDKMPYTGYTCQGINGRFVCPKIAAVQLTPGFLGRVLANQLGSGFFGVGMKSEKREDWHSRVYKPNDHSGDFYSSPEWLKLRRECFYRDNYHCMRCNKRFKVEGLNAHHLRPRNDGGDDILENLVTLCDKCHDIVEIANYRTLADIAGSYEQEPIPTEAAPEPRKYAPDPYRRPEWHKWVYGGIKRKS